MQTLDEALDKLQTSKFRSSLDKKETLLEELGHYYYDATYKFTSSAELISKQEYRAKKFSYNILVPYEKLKSAILNRVYLFSFR